MSKGLYNSSMSKNKKYTFEDFTPGTTFNLGPYQVSAEEIIAFASEFDPQPMHLDEEAGKQSLLGGLAASGWHTCCMLMRMMIDSFVLESASQGAPGVDFVQWKKPVLAGDILHGTSTVLAWCRCARKSSISETSLLPPAKTRFLSCCGIRVWTHEWI